MTLLLIWGGLSALLCTALVTVVAAQWSARTAGRLLVRRAVVAERTARAPRPA